MFLLPYNQALSPGDSTVNQHVDISNSFCKAVDQGKEVQAVFCDISKAFDRVWHKGLLYNLQTVAQRSLLQWFTDYLNNRKQMVALPGAFSQWSSASQRSILGFLLFLIYINDIVLDINSSMRLFAGNTNLYILVENLVQSSVPFTSIYMGI